MTVHACASSPGWNILRNELSVGKVPRAPPGVTAAGSPGLPPNSGVFGHCARTPSPLRVPCISMRCAWPEPGFSLPASHLLRFWAGWIESALAESWVISSCAARASGEAQPSPPGIRADNTQLSFKLPAPTQGSCLPPFLRFIEFKPRQDH